MTIDQRLEGEKWKYAIVGYNAEVKLYHITPLEQKLS